MCAMQFERGSLDHDNHMAIADSLSSPSSHQKCGVMSCVGGPNALHGGGSPDPELELAEAWIRQALQAADGGGAGGGGAITAASSAVVRKAPVSRAQALQVALMATGEAAATAEQLHAVLFDWLKVGGLPRTPPTTN